MADKLNRFRRPGAPLPWKKEAACSLLIILLGLLSGSAAKWFDITSETLGTFFSRMSIWIFFGTFLSVFSSTPKRASLHSFLFFANMIVSYYWVAELTKSVYSWSYIRMWSTVTFLSPIFAYFTWYAKGKGWFPIVLRCGILLFMALSSLVLFRDIHISDFIVMLLTAVILFREKNHCRKG